MQTQRYGTVMLPFLLYMLYKKWYLNETQQLILISNVIVLIGLIAGGWVSTLLCLLAFGYHNLMVLQLCRATNMFQRAGSSSHSTWIQKFFMMQENQIKIFVYLVYFWIFIRINSLKSLDFDLGEGTITELAAGWNCLLTDWSFIYFLWLLLATMGLASCIFLIKYDQQKSTVYKIYLLKYKIGLDVGISIFTVFYNWSALNQCSVLKDCIQLYRTQAWARCIITWGLPFSTLLFFWQRHGVFEQRGTSKTDGSNQQQKQLNKKLVNEQYNQKIHPPPSNE